MKTVGIIGGIGPESTIEYYRGIIAVFRERQSGPGVPDNHAQDPLATNYPSIILNSINLTILLGFIMGNKLDQGDGSSRQ